MLQTALFRVARILNAVQQNILRRVKAEVIDSLNNIPQLEGKTEKSLSYAIDYFVKKFNTIV
jgi:hypothetical protein